MTQTQSEPSLGLATTRELIHEIAVRMELTQFEPRWTELQDRDRQLIDNLGRLAWVYLTTLDDATLNYKTFDPEKD